MIRLCAFADEASKSIYEQISSMKKNNIFYLELRSIDGINVKDFTIEMASEYKKILDTEGIEVWSIGSPLGKVDIDCDFSEYEKEIRHVCEIANIFDCKRIRMFSFFNAYEKKEKVFEYLRKMVDIGNEYGVYMYHENEKDIYGDTIERVKEIKKNVEGLKSIYDPANFVQCGVNPEDGIKELFDSTDYFHVKDIIKSTGEIVPAGKGDCLIDRIISLIDKDMTMTLEPHLSLFDGYKDIDNTELKNKYVYKDGKEAFDAAASSLIHLLEEQGYTFNGLGYTK